MNTMSLQSVFDTRRLVERVKKALEALYSSMPYAEGDVVEQVDVHIVRLRVQLVQMDQSQREFLQTEELCRMQRVVSRSPLAMKTFTRMQRRVLFVRGLEQSELVRRKLAALRQVLESKSICYDLFVTIAARVLATSTGGQ